MNQGQSILSSLIPVWKRRSLPATTTFVSVILGASLYLIFAPRQYKGLVRLSLDQNQTSVSQIGQDLTRISSYVPGEYSPLADRAELIKSKEILRRAIALTYRDNSASSKKPTIKELRRQIKVKLIPATSILELSYQHQEPEIAAKTLDAIAEAMIDKSKQDIRIEAQSLREFLEFEVAEQQKKVGNSEALENQYRGDNQLVALDSQTENLVNSINHLETQERELQAQIREKGARVQQLQSTVSIDSTENAYMGSRVGQDRELQQLRTQLEILERKLAASRSHFTTENPMLISLEEERDELAQLYQEKQGRIIGSESIDSSNVAADQLSQDAIASLVNTKTDLASLEAKLSKITQEKLNLEQRLAVLPSQIQPLTELVRKREEANDSLKFLQRKLEEARIAEAQLFSGLKIVERAEVPDTHSSPNPPLVLAIASLVAGILSLATILILEVLDNTLCDIEEVERQLELPMLGAPPVLPTEAICLQQADRFLYDMSLVEPYRAFLRNLESRTRGKLHMLTISSTIPGEGKSVVASHLAAVAAMLAKRTLIIDADLRCPQQHQIFKVDPQAGLREVIEGCISLKDAVKAANTPNLHILTCGQLPTMPSVLLDSLEMKQILVAAESMFDLVIIDTPPVTSCADAHTLAQASNGLVMVTRPHITPKDILARAVAELKRNQVEVFGFVLNGSTAETDKYYRYSYASSGSAASQMLLAPAPNHGE